MLRVLGIRLLVFFPSLIVASIIVFGLVYLVPGDAATTIAGPDASPDQIDALRHKLGLDRPVVEQYITWLLNILHGQMGQSFVNGAEISDQLALRLPVTFELALWALLISLVLGVSSGAIAAAYHDRIAGRVIMRITGLSLAVPEFWVGMLAIAVFAVSVRWFPATGVEPWSHGVGEHLRSIFLPALILSIGASAIISRITRSAMIEVLSSTFVRTEWALGLPRREIYPKFALKNVAIPVVTVVGLVLGTLLGGTVFIERIFNIPGMGSFIVNAALIKDIPAIQASLLVVVALVMTVNLLVDLSYNLLDPRTRREHQ